jgi:hypothetical protein
MKKSFITVLFVFFLNVFHGQINEIGFFAGGTNYIGDIGRTTYVYPNEFAGGIIYKWNWNPRMALRGTLSSLPISGDDANADNYGRTNRNFDFSNTINELALGLEFNFYEYDLSSKDKTSTPYILIELAAINYQIIQNTTATPGIYQYENKTSYAIPFGVGYKSKLLGKLAIAFETKFRYTFEDDLDYSTSQFPALDFGGDGNDWYVFTGISLVYTFGRPACYSNGL